MANPITITRDEISGALDRIQADLFSEARMLQLAETGKALIGMRTLAGKDADSSPFQAYSTERYYAPLDDSQRPAGYPKPSGGRVTRKGKGKTMAFDQGYGQYKTGGGWPSTPQLSVSNKMLGDMTGHAISETEAEIFFASRESAEKAHGHITGANNLPIRMFFGFDAADESELADQLTDQIVETIKDSGAS